MHPDKTWQLYEVLIFAGAVAEILDSLDDIEVLQESGRLIRSEILAAVDDKRLRNLLEVTLNFVYKIYFDTLTV